MKPLCKNIEDLKKNVVRLYNENKDNKKWLYKLLSSNDQIKIMHLANQYIEDDIKNGLITREKLASNFIGIFLERELQILNNFISEEEVEQ